MVFCMIFTHVFGRDGFQSMVLDNSTCINMYYNIERSIMKNKVGSPRFGIEGKIYVYMYFVCYPLALFCMGLNRTFGFRAILASRGCLCY